MDLSEKTLYSNVFGKITDKRVILNYKTGSEDIPISHITSVAFQHKRNYFMAVVSFAVVIILIILLYTQKSTGIELIIFLTLIIFLLISSVANWLGHHIILISTGGQDRKPLKVEMVKTKEGMIFVEAIKKSLFK